MIKGFKEFIMRGNVIDLAVAVAIGTAFTALVTTISENLINPLLAVFGDAEFGWGFRLDPDKEATFVGVGQMVSAVVNFLVVAAVIYFLVVLPMKKLNERRRRGEEPEPDPAAVPEDIALLTEIRDLLRTRQ